MNNIKEFFIEKNIDEVLKKIKVSEFIDYVNKYIGENLVVGNKYNFNGVDNIHYIIKENIEKGLHELYNKYGIDYAIMFDFLKISTWQINLCVDYKEVSVWEFIGRYNFEHKQRKNASSVNSEFTLQSVPKFEIYDLHKKIINDYVMYDMESLNLYELYIGLLEGQRASVIANYQAEILSCKRKIADNKKMIESLEDIVF